MKKKSILLFIIASIQIYAFAQAFDTSGSFVRDTSFSVSGTFVKESKVRPFIKVAQEEITKDIEFLDSVVYSVPYEGRKLHLKIFKPKAQGKYPALLIVHGGGWSSGDFTMELPMAIRIAKQGFVTMTVEHRLSPEMPYPAAVNDLKTAVRWVRANSAFLNVDPNAIAISGCSAGGQLAGLIGATNDQEEYECKKEYPNFSSSVQAVINIDGISDFTVQSAADAAQADYDKGKLSASVRWLGGTYKQSPENWEAASAIYHVTKDSAPICFINSSIARFHDGRDEIIKKLDTYNIYTEVHSFDDTPHPFWLFDPWFVPTTDYMIAFMNKMFK
ncbi:MAG: alpha/beta hydrolase fold domain-containing protein [Dysgonomonas sp.]